MNGYDNKDLYSETSEELKKMEDSVKEEERKIEDCFKKIGKLYYTVYADRNDVDRNFVPLITAVKSSYENIALIRENQLKLKEMIKCHSCGAEIPAFSAFCNVCGVPVKKKSEPEAKVVVEKDEEAVDLSNKAEETVEETANEIVCSVCGASLLQDSVFCTECGAKISASEKTEDKGETEDVTGLLSAESFDAPIVGEDEKADEKQDSDSHETENKTLCKYCGEAIEDGCVFCTECGKPVGEDLPCTSQKPEIKVKPEEKKDTEADKPEEKRPAYKPTVGETMVLSADFAVKKCACGAVLEADAMFCTECGKPVKNNEAPAKDNPFTDKAKNAVAADKCGKCGAVLEADSMFCTECGAPVKRSDAEQSNDNGVARCSNCNTPLDEGAKRCNKCGKPVF